MTRSGMTAQQRATLFCIRTSIADKGIPPSFDEMREHLGLRSKPGVHRIINALVDRGQITMQPGRARSIALLADPVISTEDAIIAVLERCDLSEQAAKELTAKLGDAA